MPKTTRNELVVLLHGILRSKSDMIMLSSHLKKQGYKILNIMYPARSNKIEDITDYIHTKIYADPDNAKIGTIHFVTHSMGGLVARYYIARHQPKNLGKVVMLSPPNKGSEFADYLTQNKLLSNLYKVAFGPAGQQLTTNYDHIEDAITYPLGIIAGNKSINPLAFLALSREKTGEHDGIVPVARTKIEGMADHITLPVNHAFMMFDKNVIQQTEHFLKHSKFKKKKAA